MLHMLSKMEYTLLAKCQIQLQNLILLTAFFGPFLVPKDGFGFLEADSKMEFDMQAMY